MRYGKLESMSGYELRQLKREMKLCVADEEKCVKHTIKLIRNRLTAHLDKLNASIRNREFMFTVERAEDTISDMNRLYSMLMQQSEKYIEYYSTLIDVENVTMIRNGEKTLRDQKYNGRDSYTRNRQTG